VRTLILGIFALTILAPEARATACPQCDLTSNRARLYPAALTGGLG